MNENSSGGKNAPDAAPRSREEREILAIEARNRTFFELAPDGILIADPQSIYLDANPGMCAMLGYTREELVRMHATDIVDPSEFQQIEPALDAIYSPPQYQREWK